MNKIRMSVLLGALMMAASGIASAQFGGLANALGGGKSGGSVSAEQIVKRYVNGTQSVMNADANMLAALGLKDESEKAALHAKNLTEGATKDALEGASKVQTDSSKALEEHMAGKKVVMDEESKKRFANGLADLARGVIQYVGVSKDMSGFKPSVTSLGAAANSAVYIVQSLPGSLKSVGSTLKTAIDFAKSNNIPLPKEANDATALL
ncbi:hypothetical protein MJ904_04860 [Massilia sp. MB5]|uniref:hypothetical protein n=1 Tax=unclassified Massilia TaxID=2609279 RepID=UPI000B1F35D0|nr:MULTISPECIES: hypothetical protein [unclassified Massilia]UMR31555.1 hypothetical protein MJ904_04860 [Massilia sp. MB5]